MASKQEPQQERQIARTVAEILAAGLAVDVTLGLLKKALAPLRLPLKAVKAAFELTRRSWEDPIVPGEGPVGTKVNARAWQYRARYLMNAAKRLGAALLEGRPLKAAVQKELRYADQHLTAQRSRAQVARNVDAAVSWSEAMTGRREFRWRTMRDSRVSPECARVEGKIFAWNQPPTIHGLPTYPGGVHPHCRCVAEPVGVRLSGRPRSVIPKGGQHDRTHGNRVYSS